MWHLCLIVRVHYEPSPMIGLKPRKVEAQVCRVALPTCGVHDDLGSDLLPGRERRDRATSGTLYRGDLLTETEGHGVITKGELQGFNDLGIAEVEHVVPLLH